jgi:hypothetical protein
MAEQPAEECSESALSPAFSEKQIPRFARDNNILPCFGTAEAVH